MSFWNWVQKKLDNRPNTVNYPSEKKSIAVGESSMGDRSLDFKVFFAEGGVVVQRYYYDSATDRSSRKLFLIHEDADVAKEIGDFVSMEILRQ